MIRAVQVVTLLVVAVIKDDIKTPGRGNNELVQGLVRQTAAVRTARDVVKAVDPIDIEGNMPGVLDESQIAARV